MADAEPPMTIAGEGEGVGRVALPVGVAVKQDGGDLYVADRNNFRIAKFDSSGDFLMAWGWGVADGLSQELQACGPSASPPTKRCFRASSTNSKAAGAVIPAAIAVDQSSGDIYVADANNRRITKFSSTGEFLFMVGKEVDIGGGTPSNPGNICTAEFLDNGDTCGEGKSGSGPNQFTSPFSLAIDSSGQIWVGDANRLASFSATGIPGAEIALPGAGNVRSLAIDSEDNFYIKGQSLPDIRKLEAGTGSLLCSLDASGQPLTAAVDADDNVYVGDATSPYHFLRFDSTCQQTSHFGTQVIGTPGNTASGGNSLAVGEETGDLYVASSRSTVESAVQAFPIPEPGPLPENQHAEAIEPTGATLAAELNPEGHGTEYYFEYGPTSTYGSTTSATSLAGTGFDFETVGMAISALTPATTYHFRLVATNECEPGKECTVRGPDTTFTTRPAVAIDSQWASDVAARSAALHAELDPLGVEGSWWIEYGLAPCSSGGCTKTAEAALPASFGDIAVGAILNGLQPGTEYHYRFAARDKREGVEYFSFGEDCIPGYECTFTTESDALELALADGRVWEMVSPPNKFGARLRSTMEGQIQAAAGGDALAYLSLGSIEADSGGNRAPEDSSVLARRGSDGAWSSRDITPPNETSAWIGVGFGDEYKLFSSDLSRAALERRSVSPLSPKASERTPYLRYNGEPPTYAPMVTGKEGFANVPVGTEFGTDPGAAPNYPLGAVRFVDATPDLAHTVLRSAVPLVAGAAPFSLYTWDASSPPADQIRRVSLKPDDSNATDPALGSGAGSVRHAISTDGSRVFWSAEGHLYLRDLPRGESLRLDVVQPGALGSGTAKATFLGANPAGTVALFTDTQQLTVDSGATSSKADLYRCQITLEGGALGCELSDLTPETERGESADVLGLAAGMSESADTAYFVARGVLDAVPNGMKEAAASGQPNLYLWRRDAGVHFIARLSQQDIRTWGQVPTGCCFASVQSAAASPSGRYLAFMSQRSLTGYDNRDASSGDPTQEVFRYDATENELICASCNPSGGRPKGLRIAEGPAQDVDPRSVLEGLALAAVLPEAEVAGTGDPSLYRPRAIHDNGRLFFNAADSLVPADSNGNWDVYQYESSGVGTCSASAGDASVARSAGGCVGLISSGTGEQESTFLDASVGGNDAFFLSSAQLAASDEDGAIDVYDARVGGVAARRTPRSECVGEACQPMAAVPSTSSPSVSMSFEGPGNVREGNEGRRCPKGKHKVRSKKGRTRCAPNARVKKKGHKSKKKGHKRKHRVVGGRGSGR